MTRRGVLMPLLLLAAALAAGCTAKEVYNATDGWRRNECYKISDLERERRERCLKEAERPYEAYRDAQAPAR